MKRNIYKINICNKYVKVTNLKTGIEVYICKIKTNIYKELCKKLKVKNIDNQIIKGYKLKKILQNYY